MRCTPRTTHAGLNSARLRRREPSPGHDPGIRARRRRLRPAGRASAYYAWGLSRATRMRFSWGTVQAEQPPVDARSFRAASEIIECAVCRSDDVLADEPGPFARPVLGMLEHALPFDDRPSRKIVLGEPREDRGEIDLTVAQRSQSPGALHPGQIGTIYASAAVGTVFGILDVKHPDPRMVCVDERQIIHTLEQEMARVVQHAAARMSANLLQEALKAHTVVKILARVDLIADVNAGSIEALEDWPPAPRQLPESLLHEAGRPLPPPVQHWAEPRNRKRRLRRQGKALAGAGREQQLIDGPGLARLCTPAQRCRRESIKQLVVRRMNRNELTLQMRAELGNADAGFATHAGDLVAICLAVRRKRETEQVRVPRWYLYADVANSRRPRDQAFEGVEWRPLANELSQIQAGSAYCFHFERPSVIRFSTMPLAALSAR